MAACGWKWSPGNGGPSFIQEESKLNWRNFATANCIKKGHDRVLQKAERDPVPEVFVPWVEN